MILKHFQKIKGHEHCISGLSIIVVPIHVVFYSQQIAEYLFDKQLFIHAYFWNCLGQIHCQAHCKFFYLFLIYTFSISFKIFFPFYPLTKQKQIAHMTKGEIFLFDTCLIGPVALLLNQYFSYIIPELIVLVASLVIIIESDLQQNFHFM